MKTLSANPPAEATHEDNEATLLALTSVTLDAFVTLDADQRIRSFNPAAERLFGYQAEEVLGKPIDLLIPERFRKAHQEHVRRFGLSGETRRPLGRLGEVIGRRRDGKEFAVEAAIAHVRTARGSLYVAALRDLTPARFRAAIDMSPDMVLIIDPVESRYIDANDTACRELGYTREELMRMGPQDIFPKSREDLTEGYRRLIAGDLSEATVEGWYRRKDGSQLPIDSKRRAVPTARGHIIVAVARDIAERKEAMEALRRSAAHFRSLSALSADSYWEQSKDLRFTSFATSVEWEPGRAETLIGKTRWETHYVNMTDADWAAHRALLEAHRPFRDLELCRYDETGRKLWVRVSGEPVLDDSGAFAGYRGVARNITERRRAEELRELEHTVTRRLADADTSSAGLEAVIRAVCETEGWECGRYFRVDETSALLRFASGWAVPDPAVERFLAASRERTYRPGQGLSGLAWQTGKQEWSTDVTKDPRTGSGSSGTTPAGIGIHGAFVFPIASDGRTIGVLNFASRKAREPEERLMQTIAAISGQIGQLLQRKEADERRQLLETQLRQAQKLQALGTLATGIAHEFNNVLGAILANVELARMDAAPGHPVRESIDEIDKASRRARDIVHQILTFARPRAPQRRRLMLDEVAREAVRMVRVTLPARIELAVDLSADAPAVLADATQINQLIVNLCTNAWQAMDGNSGRILIRVREVALDAAAAARTTPGLHAGRFARLSVSDSGTGIDPAIREHIFDPFFSTKPTGEGTGLGLAVVHGIVRAHEGAIEVESKPGEGTTFHVLLPAAQGKDEPEGARDAQVRTLRRARSVLYLDDNENLVSAVTRTLPRHGHRVAGHTAAEAALDAVRAAPQAYDLFVSDYTMAGWSGLEVARELFRIRADLPVVIISGYVDDQLRRMARELGVRQVLSKPYTLDELLDAIDRSTGEAAP